MEDRLVLRAVLDAGAAKGLGKTNARFVVLTSISLALRLLSAPVPPTTTSTPPPATVSSVLLSALLAHLSPASLARAIVPFLHRFARAIEAFMRKRALVSCVSIPVSLVQLVSVIRAKLAIF